MAPPSKGRSRHPRPRKNTTDASLSITRRVRRAPAHPPPSVPVEPVWGQGEDEPLADEGIGVPIPLSAIGMLFQRWQDMEESEPEAPDDVDPEKRQIGPGTRLLLTEFSETRGPLAYELVAVSGVCRGALGKQFVWACTPEHWALHQRTSLPVSIRTIDLERVTETPG